MPSTPPIGGLQPFVQALNKALRGRGGGKAKFVQGSLSATRAEIEDLPPSRPGWSACMRASSPREASCFASKLDRHLRFFLLTVFILWVPSSGYQNIVWPKHLLFSPGPPLCLS